MGHIACKCLFPQFEAGVYTTAMVLDSAYKLSAAAKLAPTLTEVRKHEAPVFVFWYFFVCVCVQMLYFWSV